MGQLVFDLLRVPPVFNIQSFTEKKHSSHVCRGSWLSVRFKVTTNGVYSPGTGTMAVGVPIRGIFEIKIS